VGDNGQGKTNFLEAIYVMAAGSSFRSAADKDLVNYEASNFVIKSSYDISDRSIDAMLRYDVNGLKSFTINNKKPLKFSQDRLKVVLFTPDDLFLVKGNPGRRRVFLDAVLKQLSAEYAGNLDKYVKILKKRNLLLKTEQTKSRAFGIINELFIDSAVKIIIPRINLVHKIEELARAIYSKNSTPGNDLKIKYALSFAVDSDKINLNILQNALQKHLQNNREKEAVRRQTLAGPHLDDINFYHNDRLARIHASQGQQRNMVISVKLAEIQVIKNICGCYPIFLLDEVLAELDEEKRFKLLWYLEKASFQTYLTSVHFEEKELPHQSIVQIKEGSLIRKE
jgi:DNA replication and repair protein RecF